MIDLDNVTVTIKIPLREAITLNCLLGMVGRNPGPDTAQETVDRVNSIRNKLDNNLNAIYSDVLKGEKK